MAANKTQKTTASVAAFIEGNRRRRAAEDCRAVLKLMRDATDATPKMWGPAIVGFGDWRY